LNTVSFEGRAITPSKIVCVGRNYVEHIAELGNEMPSEMVIFVKPNSAIGAQLQSRHSEPLHYEGELCLLVEKNSFAALGFGLDLTKRALQSRLKEKGLPWERAKAFNGAALFSEFVRIPESLDEVDFELRIDGEPVQQGNIELMIYKPADILREISSFMDLCDGDIVMTGTPKGVGPVTAGARFEAVVRHRGQEIVSAAWEADGVATVTR